MCRDNSVLPEAAKRVGRFDWKNLAASTFIDIVLAIRVEYRQGAAIAGAGNEASRALGSGCRRILGYLVQRCANLCEWRQSGADTGSSLRLIR